MAEFRRVFTKRFIALLIVLTAFFLFFRIGNIVPSGVPVGNFWIQDDSSVIHYLKVNIDTSYNYTKLWPVKVSGSSQPFIEPEASGIVYRAFTIYQYNPDSTNPKDNFRIDGWVELGGNIRFYAQVRDDLGYI